jgi:hypothetical protein
MATNDLPRIGDFRSDLSADEIAAATAAEVRSIAAQSYLHGVPAFIHMRQLTEFIQGREATAPDEAPLGKWLLVRTLSDAQTTNTLPNVDTLYGASYILLDEQGPFVVTVPPIPDRYYSVAFLDAYFNNFEIVSPRTYGNDGGTYLVVPPGWEGDTPAGIDAVFVAPTPNINIYQRIFVRDETEYDVLHGIQDAIELTPLATWRGGSDAVPAADLSPYRIEGMRMTRDPLEFFERVNFYRGLNPPPAEDGGLMALFATAGLGPGSTVPDDPATRTAIAQGAADAQATINARISAGPFRNGWRVPDPYTGLAGPHILSRATAQLVQIGSFYPAEAIYFIGLRDADGRVLDGTSRRYRFTFAPGEAPPLREYGFWSLTMYNADSFLVDNPLDRYILRPDSPGLVHGDDGSLTLAIQAEAPTDVPEANWLPAPKGGFFVTLRTYLSKPAIVDGTWFPPALVALD